MENGETAVRRRRTRRRGGGLGLVVVLLVLAAAAWLTFGGSAEDVFAAFAPAPGVSDTQSPDGAEGQAPEEDGWQLLLVNRWNPLPEGYDPELTQLTNGEKVDSRIYPSLQAMFDDARAAGVYPIVCSGYRTAAKQERLYREEIEKFKNQGYPADEAERIAQTWVAIPGTSEHQAGLAVDVYPDERSTADEVYSWFGENSWRYGFILRYPEDKTEETGVSYEPWHFRYVGSAAAKEIFESGVCLEEYLA